MRLTGQSKNVYVDDPTSGVHVPYGQQGPQPVTYPGAAFPPAPIQLPIQQGSQQDINMLRAYMVHKNLWHKRYQQWLNQYIQGMANQPTGTR